MCRTRLRTYLKFIYAIFFKPHGNAVDGGQQSALESFYATQVRIAQASITMRYLS